MGNQDKMKVYNVTRYRVPAFIVSGFFILVFWTYTVFIIGGFNFGIDLKAGLNIVVDMPTGLNEQELREILVDFNPQIQKAGDEDGRFIIRIADNSGIEDFQRITTQSVFGILSTEFESVEIVSEEYIGTSFAASLATQTIWLTLIALGLILLYVWIRFKLNYAVSAVAAVLHDVLFLLGLIGALQFEFSTATIAAVLTIIGYSLNDTIVIFDRIRENARITKDMSFKEVINQSISQSLSRTLITSFTTLLAVIAILIFATGTIQTFALSLAVGIVVGTYSSIFVASPILLIWHDRRLRKTRRDIAATLREADSPSRSTPSDRTRVLQARRQSAEEIAAATLRRAKLRAKKKKRK